MSDLVSGRLALVAAVQTPRPEEVTPGFAGFVVVFLLALVTVLLIRSMVGHLRKVRYAPVESGRPDRPAPDDAEPDRLP